MDHHELQFIDIDKNGKSRRIAVRHLPPATPEAATLVWLIGLKSDMVSTKAQALAEYCAARGLGLLRFDYSGHGESSGAFADATTSDWIDEAESVIRQKAGPGPLILVGSSTGAHVALIALRNLMADAMDIADRIRALVLIAPAWDVTELLWSNLPSDAQHEIIEKGAHDQPSEYGEPYHITRAFIEDGRRNLLRDASFNPGRPIYVLQGAKDTAVPLAYARQLADVLEGDWVHMTEVDDGEHRMSRPQDLEKLYALIETARGT